MCDLRGTVRDLSFKLSTVFQKAVRTIFNEVHLSRFPFMESLPDVGFVKMVDFLYAALTSTAFLSSFIAGSSLKKWVSACLHRQACCLLSPFSLLDAFYFFSCLIALASASSVMLNGSGENRPDACLALVLEGERQASPECGVCGGLQRCLHQAEQLSFCSVC